MTGVIDERLLAKTFDGGYYDDAYEVVQQYREATRYAAKHGVKSGATASALELPRSRLRGWIDGDDKPDGVRAIEIARDYGWLECDLESSTFTGLNALVANVFSGGSIAAETYAPMFALNHLGRDSHVLIALELAGVEYEIVREGESDRATEARPTESASVLGRVLAVLGAPVGPKADQRLSLPSYLEDAPEDVLETFVYAYLENRAAEYEGKDTLRVMETRNRSYLEELAVLVETVADGRVSVDDRGITISADAARNLGPVR